MNNLSMFQEEVQSINHILDSTFNQNTTTSYQMHISNRTGFSQLDEQKRVKINQFEKDQEDFKQNVDKLLNRINSISRHESFKQVSYPQLEANSTLGLHSKLIEVDEKLNDHEKRLFYGLETQLKQKIQELTEAQEIIRDILPTKEKYKYLDEENKKFKTELDQCKLYIVKLEHQVKILSDQLIQYQKIPFFNQEGKEYEINFKYNELESKYLLLQEEVQRLYHLELYMRKQMNEQSSELQESQIQVIKLKEDIQLLQQYEIQNIDLKQQLIQYKSEVIQIRSELDKYQAKNQNDVHYIKTLEEDIEGLRRYILDKLKTVDTTHILNLYKTKDEHNDIIQQTYQNIRQETENELNEINKENEIFKRQLLQSEDQITSLRNQLNLSQKENSQLKNKLDQLLAENDLLNRKLKETEDQALRNQNEFKRVKQDLEEQLRQALEKHEKDIEHGDGKVEMLIYELNKLHSQNEQNEQQQKVRLNNSLYDLNSQKNNELNLLKNQLESNHQKRINALQQQIKELSDKIVILTKSNTDLERSLASLNQEREALNKNNHDLYQNNQQLNLSLNQMIAHLKQKDENQVNLNNQLAQAQAEIKSLRKQLDDITKSNKDAGITKEQLHLEKQKLAKENEKLKGIIAKENDDKIKYQNQIKEKQAKIEQQQDQLQTITKYLEETKRQHNKEIEKYKKDIQIWQVNVQEMQKQITTLKSAQDSFVQEKEKEIQSKAEQQQNLYQKSTRQQQTIVTVERTVQRQEVVSKKSTT